MILNGVTSSKPGDDTNAIKVSVVYQKGSGFVARAYPATERANCIAMQLSMTIRPPSVLLAERKTNNAKLLAFWEQEAQAQLTTRTGTIWGLVLKVCEQHGLTAPQ